MKQPQVEVIQDSIKVESKIYFKLKRGEPDVLRMII